MCRSLVKKLKDCDIGVYATKSMRAPEFSCKRNTSTNTILYVCTDVFKAPWLL